MSPLIDGERISTSLGKVVLVSKIFTYNSTDDSAADMPLTKWFINKNYARELAHTLSLMGCPTIVILFLIMSAECCV